MKLSLRAVVLLAVALLSLPLAACGHKTATTTVGETEGTYLDVGNLKYQVQISRQLNPNDPEDHAYFVGLPEAERQLAPDEAWFAVFMRVQNTQDKPAPATSDFTITDTQDNVYRPLGLGPDNVFAYHPGVVAGGAQIPVVDSPAYNTPSIGGALLLFKVKNFSFDNRPLELAIKGAGTEATVALDV